MKRAKVLKRVGIIVSILFLISIVVLLIVERVPIEKRYNIEDIEENQAVMAVYYTNYGCTKMAAITKNGNWKCTDITNIKKNNRALPVKDRKDTIEIIDEIMADDTIPYQERKLKITSKMLEKVINISPFKYTHIKKNDGGEVRAPEPTYTYFAVTGTGKERNIVKLGQKGETRYRFDINVMMMIHKLDQLEAMRKEVME